MHPENSERMENNIGEKNFQPLFQWETLQELNAFNLEYKEPIPGKKLAVQLRSGQQIFVWRAEDRQEYFFHGLTFGGKSAPGGPISPFSGEDVLKIIKHHYHKVEIESSAIPGDVLVWESLNNETPHSAILVGPVISETTKLLDYSAKVLTKNGREPEMVMTLEQLILDYYGESFNIYRRIA